MGRSFRPLCLTVLLLLVAVFMGLGVAKVGWVRQPKRKAIRWDDPPSNEMKALERRIKAREEIARQVVNKEMTLFEAAAWFSHLNEKASLPRKAFWEKVSGKSDNEKLCRQVLVWVREHLIERKRSPEEVDAAV